MQTKKARDMEGEKGILYEVYFFDTPTKILKKVKSVSNSEIRWHIRNVELRDLYEVTYPALKYADSISYKEVQYTGNKRIVLRDTIIRIN